MSVVVAVKDLVSSYNQQIIHNELDLTVYQGDICAIVGNSGSGKTTLLHSILQLHPPVSGDISLFGQSVIGANQATLDVIRRKIGVLFQHGALFSSLTVLENLMLPLRELLGMEPNLAMGIAKLRLHQVGLSSAVADKYPNALSGGMVKRVALARAIALEPQLLFLDEPTAGLDPNSANKFEQLIRELSEVLQLSIVMITHDLDTLWELSTTVAFLDDGKIAANLPIDQLVNADIPAIRGYFSGKRAQLHYQK